VYILNKKDIVALNQSVGEAGAFINENSLDFSLHFSKIKKNWLYKLSYLVQSFLVDHVFQDGNKRTCFLVVVYYVEYHGKKVNKDRLLMIIRRIAAKNITNPVQIVRLLYHVIKEKSSKLDRRE